MKKLQKKTKGKIILNLFQISLVFVTLGLVTGFLSIFFSVKLENDAIISNHAIINIYNKENQEISLPPKLNSYVEYKDISPHIINAFVALEDKRFYKHKGIDFIRMGGALKNNIRAGYIREGGSTISQQLAKNTQLNNKKSIVRKIKEAKLALDIEKKYSKEEILEMYLNAIYFGSGIYGINDACMRFFDKEPSEIELYEAAILAGVVKNPSKNSPLLSQENANNRKNLVLKLMREQNMIDNKAYIENIAYTYKPLAQITKKDINSPFISTLIHEAANILNISEKEIIRSGYRISTYYDDKIQHAMFKAFESEEFAPKNQNGMCPDYSALMLDNATGGVCAYYASYDLSPLNMKRQPGSAIKPILVYAPAFEKNHITPASVYNDKRTQFGDYKPKNYMDDYKGEIPIRDAIKNSSNVIAVSLLNEIGIDYAKEYAQRMGINFSANDNYLSLALGGMTDGCTPLELGGAYMTLANGGKHTKPTFIREIRDKYGNILYKHTPYFTQAISKQTAFLLTDILKDTAKNGTAKKLKNLEFDVAAKTGTVGATNSFNNDAWNLSYTRENTLCVWYGNINYEKEKAFNLTGGTYPTMFAKYIYQNIAQKPASFTPPDGIVRIKIDTLALRELRKAMQASDNTPQKYYKYEYFNIKNAPIEMSPLFVMPDTNLFVEFDEAFFPKISFFAQSDYVYKVIRRNLATGEEKTVHTVSDIQGEIMFNDKEVNGFGLIGYRIEIENKYSIIGHSKEKFIFFNELLPVIKNGKR